MELAEWKGARRREMAGLGIHSTRAVITNSTRASVVANVAKLRRNERDQDRCIHYAGHL